MRWLHLSDLHCAPENDGRNTLQLRTKLVDYLKNEEIRADYLFLTGDYRHAGHLGVSEDSDAEQAAEFILQLAKAAEVPRDHIFLVPGNHDLTRTGDCGRITRIQKEYDIDSGKFQTDDMTFLLERFSFFQVLIQKLRAAGAKPLWPDTLMPLHLGASLDGFNLLLLNTCLLCNSDEERGKLLVGNYDLYSALCKMRAQDQPTIVLAHHGLDNFREDEKRVVEQIFQDSSVCLYLCGDAHFPWPRRNNDLLEVTMGCLVQQQNTRTVFSVGELKDGDCSIEAHEWDTSLSEWGEYSQFNKRFRKWPLRVTAAPSAADEPAKRTVQKIVTIKTGKTSERELFRRTVCDIFHAHGFDHAELIRGELGGRNNFVLQHRTEKHIAFVEFSARDQKVQAAALDQFAAALDAQRTRYEEEGTRVTGYFISRTGFAEAALARTWEGLILLGPSEIAQKLIQGGMLCSQEQALAAVRADALIPCGAPYLIACEQGWIWLLYYSDGSRQGATHFTLVHADGNPLISSITDSLMKRAVARGLSFSDLSYIGAPPVDPLNRRAAQTAYYQYLKNELGEIQFEGMPTDKEAGAVKVNLENIFVPLEFYPMEGESAETRITINQVLEKSSKSAILAKPGGGKSTLLRRIALAYAYPDRRKKVDDKLPDRNWFPIYIRCRDLGGNATKSISEIMGTLADRAEIGKYAAAFRGLIEDALQKGRVLLLIDGLDEISIESNRIRFVSQLRTFVATYPTLHLVVTSRETGFRVVAGTLAGYCGQYSIADLNQTQIAQLSLKWHQALLGETEQAKTESKKVCGIILSDSRITALAANPLLLTTLLFVKRWVGYLPTKKCRLYEEMIKLLLVTWNAAAHDKLDLDETEPQLAFVAYKMTMKGVQKITKPELERCVIESRKAMPELLSYTTVSPARFIDQVEERSSLIIQLGVEEDAGGRHLSSYEFSHLSFQEYMTAKAITESWLPNFESQDLLECLEPHLEEDHWKEVIPLAAVLAGRAAKPLIERLMEMSRRTVELIQSSTKWGKREQKNLAPLHLANCIASEVPMSQEMLEEAITLVAKLKQTIEMQDLRGHFGSSDVFATICKSKYGSTFCKIVTRMLFEQLQPDFLYEASDLWLGIYCQEHDDHEDLNVVIGLITDGSYQNRITGALLLMINVFRHLDILGSKKWRTENAGLFDILFSAALQMLRSGDLLSQFVSSWSIAWAGYNHVDIISDEIALEIANRLIELWVLTDIPRDLKRSVSWALYSVCRPNLPVTKVEGFQEAVERNLCDPQTEFDPCAAIHMGILTGQWSKEEALKRLKANPDPTRSEFKESRFLSEMGYS